MDPAALQKIARELQLTGNRLCASGQTPGLRGKYADIYAGKRSWNSHGAPTVGSELSYGSKKRDGSRKTAGAFVVEEADSALVPYRNGKPVAAEFGEHARLFARKMYDWVSEQRRLGRKPRTFLPIETGSSERRPIPRDCGRKR